MNRPWYLNLFSARSFRQWYLTWSLFLLCFFFSQYFKTLYRRSSVDREDPRMVEPEDWLLCPRICVSDWPQEASLRDSLEYIDWFCCVWEERVLSLKPGTRGLKSLWSTSNLTWPYFYFPFCRDPSIDTLLSGDFGPSSGLPERPSFVTRFIICVLAPALLGLL